MAVYYSFHYDRDNWRVQQVMNMGQLDGQPILTSQDWEAVKKRGKAAIEQWIADNMAYKSAVVVLVGRETSTREWVRYEIIKAWNDKRPLVGVRIHGLKDGDGKTDIAGPNPFSEIKLDNGGNIGQYVTLHTPAGADSQAIYDSINKNIVTWANGAYKRS
jgi:hypothetical protein